MEADSGYRTPWYVDGLQFSCTQCGRCCGGAPGYVWVEDDEIAAIAASLAMSVEVFRKKHTRRAGKRRSLRERKNGDCEFLEHTDDGKTRCAIHAVRPLQCRTWPFWESNMRTAQRWEAAARECPGMNKGSHHPLPVIQDALRRNAVADLPL